MYTPSSAYANGDDDHKMIYVCSNHTHTQPNTIACSHRSMRVCRHAHGDPPTSSSSSWQTLSPLVLKTWIIMGFAYIIDVCVCVWKWRSGVVVGRWRKPEPMPNCRLTVLLNILLRRTTPTPMSATTQQCTVWECVCVQHQWNARVPYTCNSDGTLHGDGCVCVSDSGWKAKWDLCITHTPTHHILYSILACACAFCCWARCVRSGGGWVCVCVHCTELCADCTSCVLVCLLFEVHIAVCNRVGNIERCGGRARCDELCECACCCLVFPL